MKMTPSHVHAEMKCAATLGQEGAWSQHVSGFQQLMPPVGGITGEVGSLPLCCLIDGMHKLEK